MSKVLEILEKELQEAKKACDLIEDEIAKYKAFLSGELIVPVKHFVPKRHSVKNNNNDDSEKKVTFVSQITDALKERKRELTSSDIAYILLPYYEAKGRDISWVKNRLGNVLVEAVSPKHKIYSSPLPGHGRTKVYGLYMFKDSEGNVKEEHKYESLL